MRHFTDPLVLIDVETTGGSPAYDRITEIACIRLEQGRETDRFVTLLDPERPIPEAIARLTGITDALVADAPTFYQIIERLEEIFSGAVFAAHNARFDYGFVKAEMERHGRAFKKRLLCTVRLSRALFPEHREHNLSALITRHGFECAERHRALGDTLVLKQLLTYLEKEHGSDKFIEAMHSVMERTRIPPQLSRADIEALPQAPGVYRFFDSEDALLYVGKSRQLRSRVLGHFGSTHTSGKEMRLFQETARIEWQETGSDFGASLLELSLIKTLEPVYNRQSRRTRTLWRLVADTPRDGYFRFSLKATSAFAPEDFADTKALFRSQRQAVGFLEALCEKEGFCKKTFGLEKGPGGCFHSQLGTCSGACTGSIKARAYNAKLELALRKHRLAAWPYAEPMVIVADSGGNALADILVVDHWIIQEAWTGDRFQQAVSSDTPLYPGNAGVFDYDAYRLLAKALLTPDASLRILPLSQFAHATLLPG